MTRNVRVRFAPSPTGPLHIGGVRTALYNYLFAKKHQGSFILRIEDTDQQRYVEGSEEYIIESLGWCGLSCDEGPHVGGAFGPYRQSERQALYREYAEALVAGGHAYYAFDTAASLELLRANLQSSGKTFSYNWESRGSLLNSLSLPAEETREKLKRGTDYVIRFKSPENEKLLLQDLIRGTIEMDTNTLDDKVLFKSDGMPTYHLANIVDDHLMQISHVIRGEEWLPSLALHYQLYQAFGWEPPQFAHLPLIMKPEGKGKLSKRDGEKLDVPVLPLEWGGADGYRERGYFPEAVVNFLALLGWNPGTEQELYSLDELIHAFSLERVHKSGARFDPDKTKWYNHQYLQKKSISELALLFRPLVKEKLAAQEAGHGVSERSGDPAFLEATVALLKDRATFVSDLWDLGDYFFLAPSTYNDKAVRKHWQADSAGLLTQLMAVLDRSEPYTATVLEANIKEWIRVQELSFGRIMPQLRLVLVGDLKGPHLFDIMALLGKRETLARINRALALLDISN